MPGYSIVEIPFETILRPHSQKPEQSVENIKKRNADYLRRGGVGVRGWKSRGNPSRNRFQNDPGQYREAATVVVSIGRVGARNSKCKATATSLVLRGRAEVEVPAHLTILHSTLQCTAMARGLCSIQQLLDDTLIIICNEGTGGATTSSFPSMQSTAEL